MLNQFIFVGNLGRDPEMKLLPSGMQTLNFSLATKRNHKTESGKWGSVTTWIWCKCYGNKALYLDKYCRKGDLLLVQGHVGVSTSTHKGSTAVYQRYDFLVDKVTLIKTKPLVEKQVEEIPTSPEYADFSDMQDDESPF